MRRTNQYWSCKINGTHIYPPDELSISAMDIDSEETQRDESAYMHRVVLRRKVKTFAFEYGMMDWDDTESMEALLNHDTIQFTYVADDGDEYTIEAYCSGIQKVLLEDHATEHDHKRMYKSFSFTLIEC